MNRLLSVWKRLWIDKSVFKFIAVLSMICDHFAIVYGRLVGFDTLYYIGRCFGRLAFPIFAFFIVDGFWRTSDRKKYFLRLLCLAILSEIPYNIFVSGNLIDWSNKNVVFTYVIGFLMIEVLSRLDKRTFWNVAGYMFVFMLVAELIGADYGACGLLLIGAFFLWPLGYKDTTWIYFLIVAAFVVEFGAMSILVGVSLLLLSRYFFWFSFGSKYKRFAFYLFYPLHLLLLSVFWLI